MPVSRNRRKSGVVKKRRAAAAPGPAPLPDRRAMERLLRAFGGGADDAVSKAQDIMYDAWEADSKARRVALARKALAVSPLCADAYVLLAQEVADHLDGKMDLYQKGVDAGERALGAAAFRDDVGHFWGLLKTRPYMRARCGLAVALWQKKERDAAIAHVRDMLRLNPNDNQGMRYALLGWLMELGRRDEAETLMRQYEDDSAPHWLYSEALLEFMRAGDAASSRERLAVAVQGNRHVPAYLLGKELPRLAPAYATVGGDDEAQEFARGFLAGWRDTAGALEWLAVQTGPLGAAPRAGRRQ